LHYCLKIEESAGQLSTRLVKTHRGYTRLHPPAGVHAGRRDAGVLQQGQCRSMLAHVSQRRGLGALSPPFARRVFKLEVKLTLLEES
jgi:hypothetical protein